MKGGGGGVAFQNESEKKVFNRIFQHCVRTKIELSLFTPELENIQAFFPLQNRKRQTHVAYEPTKTILAWLYVTISQIDPRPVVWGLTLQFLLGLFVLRTNVGQQTFSFLGKQVEHFLSHVIAGVEFVFGDNYKDFEFVFKVVFFYHIINNFEFSYATHLQNNSQFYSNSMYPACKHYPIINQSIAIK